MKTIHEIESEQVSESVAAFLASGGVITKLPNWVGENGYKTPMNRAQQYSARNGAGKGAKKNLKPSSRWHDPSHKNERDF